ncbi:type IV pilin [Natronolimnobius baerhuensis]|uniref:Type IV pilin n=1 Tax=Natronolimnobius baerhuensis TaxID=253108 RepID=A0A202E8Z0_9EURY|nr:type IV pilin N-terminal domain-containing protein [Natronolimnobius baerhuensis]OVE84721.1 type IV pilin [Natronolimnobius baerhuensis]
MDIEKYGKKLIGNDEERAVSPVIGVILMVAITVILAAVIAAFVLDLGGSIGEEAQAGVSIEVDESDHKIQIQVTSMGNSDEIDVRGENVDYSGDHLIEAGETLTLEPDDGLENEADVSGTVTAVAIITDDGTETQVGSADFDFEGYSP